MQISSLIPAVVATPPTCLKRAQTVARELFPYFPIISPITYCVKKCLAQRRINQLDKEIRQIRNKPLDEIPLFTIDLEFDVKCEDPTAKEIKNSEIEARIKLLDQASQLEELYWDNFRTGCSSTVLVGMFGCLIASIVLATK